MNKLVMSAAYGYGVNDLKPFVHSLRKYYDGEVIFIVEYLTDELRTLFGSYHIQYVQIGGLEFKNDIQWLRYRLYEFLLKDKFIDVDRVFVSDVRDVIFQDDPFKLSNVNFDLEFFEEPERIKNCNCNSGWIQSLYGLSELSTIGDNNIICSGTTMGSRNGMLKYFETMNNEILSFSNRGVKIKGGEDQPIHNHLIRHGKFENYIVYENGSNSVSTLDHQKEFNFDNDGKLINKSDNVIPVVHQWDRPKQFSDHFLKLAME